MLANRGSMMKKLVIAGAGAYSFAPAILEDLLVRYRLGAELWLVDADLDMAELTARAADAIAKSFGLSTQIYYTTQIEKAIPGADAVIVCADFLDEEAWKLDYEALDEVGLGKQARLYGGLGGVMQTLRACGFIAEIAEQMRASCPDEAFLLLCDNGYGGLHLCRACEAARIMGVKAYGLSANAEQTQRRLALYLGIPEEKLQVVTGGLSGFSWVSVLKDRTTGKDLIPRCKTEMAEDPREALAAQYIDWYGAIPAGDRVMQYEQLEDTDLNPRRTVVYSGIGAADYEIRKKDLADLAVYGLGHDTGFAAWQHMRKSSLRSVHPIRVLQALLGNDEYRTRNLVYPCDGAVKGVAGKRYVEGPAVIKGSAVRGEECALTIEVQDTMGQLSLCNLLYAEAASKGSRDALRQGLEIDPALMGVDLLYAEDLLDGMMRRQADRLTRFDLEA